MFQMTDRRRRAWVVAAAACLCGLAASVLGCGSATEVPAQVGSMNQEDAAHPAESAARVEAFCGDCHALPRPESFARDRWHFEVRRGYEFYAKSGRNDLIPPTFHETLAYFRTRAPEQLTFPRSEDSKEELPIRFTKESFQLEAGAGVLPEVAYLRWTRLAADEKPVLLASDMRHGQVVAIDLQPAGRNPPRILAQLRNPGRIEVCDLDGDGLIDLVVSDLGSYQPAEHDRGRIVLLRRRAGTPSYEGSELLGGLGRVAETRAADMDGDGRLDLLVAEFGWRQSGRVMWGRNLSEPESGLRFQWEDIDDRPGAIDVRVHDFTGDGRPDFVALFSQWHESVDLFENRGRMSTPPRFARRNLWTAPDLTFGSSGIELADLNGDGQMDVLYSNGDAFDNDYASPWHGVQWLENRGGLAFDDHRLTEMPGAYRAVTGDFDRDGDLDIVVGARLPPDVEPANLKDSPLASIVLLLQTQVGVFARHSLEWESPYYPTLEVADFDGNGWLDFTVASGPYTGDVRKALGESHYLTVWWNQGTGEQ